ncbi:MAG TPA: hypothetical protein PKA55_07680 [Rhodoblastus sp.]|nr:hypothetical protein [Rhodoblastus sp.]
MRKQTKSFTVEVKRRPTSLAKKQSFPEAPAPAPQPAAAAAIFAPVAPTGAAEAERRILPCLVTEAAIDAAKAAEEAEPAVAPRKRGRPPKQRSADDLAPLAPRKRGRPRKTPVEAAEPDLPAAPQTVAPSRAVPRVATAPVGASARSGARRAAVSELPRGERWKRRLPKALR